MELGLGVGVGNGVGVADGAGLTPGVVVCEAGADGPQANARIKNISRNLEEISKATAAFPVIGTAFRAYPGRSYRFSFDAEVKGMNLGNNGYYMQSSFGIGYSPTQKTTFHIGYSVLDADVHNKYETEGLRANFRGPTLSLQWRNR